MKETVRSEFISRLKDMPKEYAEIAIKSFDKVMREYDFTVKEKGMSTVVLSKPREITLYVECRKVEGASVKGMRNREILLDAFACYVAKPINEVTSYDVRGFLAEWQERRKIADGTLNTYRNYLNSFFTWCEAEGLIDKNPMRNIKPIKFEQPRRVSMTQYELENIRCACNTIMEKCLVEMLYSTGCRISELANMKLSDINLEQNIAVVHGKGKKLREVFINAKAKVALENYLKTRQDNCESVFVSSRKIEGEIVPLSVRAMQYWIQAISNRANIGKHITPHIFRHTTASIGLQNGMPIESIQQMLGHASCATTLVYADINTSKVHSEHLRCVI